jgi:catechol 2,3-dioxygenase-like lactoylglutathione lyase family enzyme
MALVGLGNLAVKVKDVDAARDWYVAAGASAGPVEEWQGMRRCDVALGTQLGRLEPFFGPEVVSGRFGTRRIAFVDSPGGVRLEFMEQLEDPA